MVYLRIRIVICIYLMLQVLVNERKTENFCLSSHQSLIFDEVDLSDASVAETSTKNINNSFTVRNTTKLYSFISKTRVSPETSCVNFLVILAHHFVQG